MSLRGRATLRTGLVVSLFLIAALPLRAQARHDPPGPDGLPPTDPEHPWKLLSGTPRVDTLSFTLRDIIPVARRQFETDRWEIFTVDADRGEIVTRWKPMHHALLRLFMGHVSARCTLTMQPLGGDRTRMVFRADLASHRNLEGNPMLGPAKRAYAKAARDYVTEVRDCLSTPGKLSSLP